MYAPNYYVLSRLARLLKKNANNLPGQMKSEKHAGRINLFWFYSILILLQNIPTWALKTFPPKV